MHWHRITIVPRTAFVTPLKGDTLFGQLCWALRELQGNSALINALEGYTEDRPFLVVSDPFPARVLPRPTVPSHLLGLNHLTASERKAAKKRRWLPAEALEHPLERWGEFLLADDALIAAQGLPEGPLSQPQEQPHNTLNRLTNATGSGAFAPYSVSQLWLRNDLPLSLYVLIDPARLEIATLMAMLTHIGQFGYGKDASVGSGKFDVLEQHAISRPGAAQPSHYLTLAPCACQHQPWQAEGSFYQVFTRFGRHGASLAVTGSPFKNPVLLAEAGALLQPLNDTPLDYVGQGLGGHGELSHVLPATVHQGYAPVIGLTGVFA